MKDLLKSFWTDESGQGLTEYALIIALVSIALIIVLILFRNEIGRVFKEIKSQLSGHQPAQYT